MKVKIHPLVKADINRSLAEARFKVEMLEMEYRALPAGAKSSMSTLRLHRKLEEARFVAGTWGAVLVAVQDVELES